MKSRAILTTAFILVAFYAKSAAAQSDSLNSCVYDLSKDLGRDAQKTVGIQSHAQLDAILMLANFACVDQKKLGEKEKLSKAQIQKVTDLAFHRAMTDIGLGLDKCVYDLSKTLGGVVQITVGFHNQEQFKGILEAASFACVDHDKLGDIDGLSKDEAQKVSKLAFRHAMNDMGIYQEAIFGEMGLKQPEGLAGTQNVVVSVSVTVQAHKGE